MIEANVSICSHKILVSRNQMEELKFKKDCEQKKGCARLTPPESVVDFLSIRWLEQKKKLEIELYQLNEKTLSVNVHHACIWYTS